MSIDQCANMAKLYFLASGVGKKIFQFYVKFNKAFYTTVKMLTVQLNPAG